MARGWRWAPRTSTAFGAELGPREYRQAARASARAGQRAAQVTGARFLAASVKATSGRSSPAGAPFRRIASPSCGSTLEEFEPAAGSHRTAFRALHARAPRQSAAGLIAPGARRRPTMVSPCGRRRAAPMESRRHRADRGQARRGEPRWDCRADRPRAISRWPGRLNRGVRPARQPAPSRDADQLRAADRR